MNKKTLWDIIRDPDCKKCDLYNYAQYVCLIGRGPHPCDTMLVGEGPGWREDDIGKPFAGKAGKLLDGILGSINVSRKDLFITNIVHCFDGYTRIKMADGTSKRIGEIVKKKINDPVLSLIENSLVPKKIVNWYRSPLKERKLFKLIDLEGYKNNIKGEVGPILTGEHRVLTEKGWIEVEKAISKKLRIHTGQVIQSKLHESWLIGNLLGDASGRSNGIKFTQCVEHINYFRWVGSLFKDELSSYNEEYKGSYKGNLWIKCHLRIKGSPLIRKLQRLFYNKGRKIIPKFISERLDPVILAALICDDGSLKRKKKLYQIALNSFNKTEVGYLQKGLKRFNIDSYIKFHKGIRLKFNVVNSNKLSKLIAPYTGEWMGVKILEEHKNVLGSKLFEFEGPKYHIYNIFKIKKVKRVCNTVYCIDVEDSHNFLTVNSVVHNCRPPENKTPKKKQMDACRGWLLKELEYVKPKRIILMGKCAIYGLFQYDDYSIEYMRGRVFKYKEAKVHVTYHPAAALRRPYLKEVIRKDLLQIFGGDSSKSTIEIKYEDLTKTQAKKLIENPPKSLAVDVETPGGVVFYKNPMTCLSFSPKAGVSYFIEDPEGMKKCITSFLENSHILKIGHSLKYDLKQLVYERYMSEKSLIENEFFCTMIAFNILDENYLDKDLEHLTDMFTSMGKWKNNDLDFSDPDRLKIRNLKDTDATKRLYNIFRKRLEAEKLLIPFKIDMSMMKVLVSAELHGIKVSTNELNELDSELIKNLGKLKIKIPIDKPNSNLQLTKFFNSKGIKSTKETENKGQSWDKNVLQDLSKKLEGKKKEIIDNILEWKKLFGIQTKFLTNLREFLDPQNIVHPVFNQTKSFSDEGDEEGTSTGRLSCKNPNLQQTPRDREDLPREINPRKLFISTYPKGSILSADYDQIEIRMAAYLANDENLIKILKEGGDVHRLVASEVLKKSPDKVTKDERKEIKKVVFGVLYMISSWGLSNKMGISEEQASKYIRFFFRAFPAQEEYQSYAEGEIIKNQEIMNIFGRKRRLPGATQETGIGRALIRQGVNFPNQGSCADIVKIACYQIFEDLIKKGLKSRIFASIHDSIDLDIFPGEENEVVKIVKQGMEHPNLEKYGVKLGVPLKTKLGIGKNWLDLKEV